MSATPTMNTTPLSQAYQALVAQGELKADPAQQAALVEFDRLTRDLSASTPPAKRSLFRRPPPQQAVRGLYVWGGVGRGKSMLMDLFAKHCPVAVRRVHFHAFMQEIHEQMHAARATGVSDAIAPVAEAVAKPIKVLALDEMQITDITDAMIVGRLFEALFNAGVSVVTTSNRAPTDLYKNGLNRQLFLPFIEMLGKQLVIHHLTSPNDYRQHRLAGGKVYFTPHGPEAEAALAAIWRDLTSNQNPQPLDITVKGRKVRLPGFHGGVGRANFADLCATPLGPGDYLALADALRVLILENIPRLSRAKANEAKRFVTLIDALYEAKVRLICSAAAEPEHLYTQGDGSFEFERTASRLREMQSADWQT